MKQIANNPFPAEKKYSSVIELNDLRLKVNLGVGEEERSKAQDVMVNLKFFSENKPGACISDNINDTICYHKMSDLVKEFVREKEFKLLEYLCYEMYQSLRKYVGQETKIWIKIEKCNPPIENLLGSTSFTYSDL